MSRAGALLAARFSFMPNRLGYCGPEENRAILDYLAEQASDRGLEQILTKFAGAFPYYSFIAATSGIPDAFDPRVIEAYWIGNELLERVEVADLHRHLEERFGRSLSAKALRAVLGQVPAGARPHHNFHVLSMPIRTGRLEIAHSLQTMDECRISWGKVVAHQDDRLLVESPPLRLAGEELVLGPPQPRAVFRRFDGKTFLTDTVAGDVVAIHWGCACYRLTARQLRHLIQYTRYHLTIANRHRRGTVLLHE